ncbi:alanine:cation symporter family protein [Enterococcus sp. 669A]|uniref:Alanine:cation symporter family protein n=1 Tax=Candidatus Enterococcus moelleringii TaxID=2815325 RepID=A0ABS3LGL4_9ENTE|nr:sodium:alanine symporter family protein [Enterococcus sp. 669A]MBO1308777.1 alanine:cation symporter family protein [Enterococcus sp. 669A]
MNDFLLDINSIIWGAPMILLILGIGVALTIGCRGIQIRRLPLALKYMVKNEEGGKGDVTSFQALCTALSATIGTGNIVGVATAIVAGGPGALFWLELAGLLGMATKYAEGLLAVKYRTFDDNGNALGGPFYYIENGLGKNWRWLAKMFAFFGAIAGLIGIGTLTQINGITSAAETFFDPNRLNTVTLFGNEYTLATMITGAVVTILVAIVLIGGVQRIARVSEIIVPLMIVIYVGLCLFMIVLNIGRLPSVIVEIVESAFGLRAVSGGALGAMMIAMQKGIARGIFSNESGLGSAPIAAAAAQSNEPVRQGLVSMTGTFIDTIIVCNMTGMAIILTGAWQQTGLEGSAVTIYAFTEALPLSQTVASLLLMLCLAFFAFTTILGWNYYSERCLSYLTNGNTKFSSAFRILYIAAVFIGPYLTVTAVWTIADIFNGLMAFPNIIALALLSPVVFKETKSYFSRLAKADAAGVELSSLPVTGVEEE